jgi:hypothetical protein
MSTEAPPAPAIEPVQPATPVADPAASTPPSTPAPPPETPPVVTDNRAAPPADPPPAPAISPDGKLGENWFLSLGDEFGPHAKDLAKHKDIRSIITELDYFRKSGVAYPGENAPAQAIERFRAVAGVPETPEGYGLTAEKVTLPEGMTFDQELADAVTKAAHKTHTPPAALAAIVGEFNGILAKRTAEAAAEAQATAKATQDALIAEWGSAFQANASTVRHITAKLAEAAGILPEDPAVQEFMADINAKPALSKILLQVSKLTREDSISMPSGFGDLKSPAQRIEEIVSGRDPVWGERYRSGDLAAYEHVKALRAAMKI